MQFQEYINQQKDLYNLLLKFIKKEDVNENDFEHDKDFQHLHKFIENKQIVSNKEEFRLFLFLLSKISNNHHRFATFLIRIEQIFLKLKDKINQTFSSSEVFNIFKGNKRIILYLINTKIITFDKYIAQSIFAKNHSECELFIQFFYPEIKPFLDDTKRSEFQEQILSKCNNDLDIFEEKRRIGENDSYICQLIRDDSYEKLAEYVNQTNLPLSSTIERSFYETNSFLIKEQYKTSLIEYAAFFGSIQTFKYLLLKNAELRPFLWFYAIHSNNAEIIHLLEENHVKPVDESYEECLKESIKCHHNDITNYILENFLDLNVDKKNIENNYNKNSVYYCFRYYNYHYFPYNLESNFIFQYACNFGYAYIVNFMLKTENPDVNEQVIQLKKIFLNSVLINVFVC